MLPRRCLLLVVLVVFTSCGPGDELASQRPGVKGKKPEDFTDARFVRELEASGYIDALYK